MQRRNREIQIFNLSMMDVISGAMGAFLIIMIILSRYYTPDPQAAKDAQKIKEQLKVVQEQLQNITEEMPDDYRELKRRLQEAQDDLSRAFVLIEKYEERINQLNSENNRLHSENEKLKEENRQMQTRNPYFVQIWWQIQGPDVDVYLQQIQPGTAGSMPAFDFKKQQWSYFSDEMYVNDTNSPGSDVWLMNNRYENIEKKIYYKINNVEHFNAAVTVRGGILGDDFDDIWLPVITLNATTPWEWVGTLTVKDSKIVFKEATTQEREKDRQEILKRLSSEQPQNKEQVSKQNQPDVQASRPVTLQERRKASRDLIIKNISDPKAREEALRHLEMSQ